MSLAFGDTEVTQQVRFFKLHFDFNVFSAENRRLFSIEFQLHTNSHITLWLPVMSTEINTLQLLKYDFPSPEYEFACFSRMFSNREN